MTRSAPHWPARTGFAIAFVVAMTLFPGALSSSAKTSTLASATGSHRYRLVLLLAGERPPLEKAVAESLQAGHLANIGSMFASGALDAAGPMGDASPLIGLFFFDSEDVDLDSLLAPDPIIRAGRLRPEAHTWIAPEGLGREYRRLHAVDPPSADSLKTYSFVLLRRGPRWTANATPGLSHLLEAQGKELERWRAEGALRMAGPIEGTGALRGVYIFAADSARTAALLSRDPVVKAGRIVPEIHPWWTMPGVVP